jgi:hypothetical protein
MDILGINHVCDTHFPIKSTFSTISRRSQDIFESAEKALAPGLAQCLKRMYVAWL